MSASAEQRQSQTLRSHPEGMIAVSIGQAWVIRWRTLLTKHPHDFPRIAAVVRNQDSDDVHTAGQLGATGASLFLWKDKGAYSTIPKKLEFDPVALDVLKTCLEGNGPNMHITDWPLKES
jgi:hypothetical protein